MKNKTHPHLGIRSSLALALALAIWAPARAQPAGPAAAKTTLADKRAEPGQAMKEQKMNEAGVMAKGYVQDIESLAIKNDEFRHVLYTAKNCQLVLMALRPKEEIGAEVHQADQFFRVEEGSGEVIIAGVRTAIRAGFAVVVPGGTEHNIINTGSVSLKLYTLYAPPNHRDGVIHHTRADAEADHEHFDGKTTE